MRILISFFSILLFTLAQGQDCGFILTETETAICGESVTLETSFEENLHSMYFNGSTSRLESPDQLEYHLEGQDFALTAWIKMADQVGRFDIMSKPSSTWASHGAYDLYLDNGYLKFTIRHEFGAPWYSHLTGPLVAADEWHHVAAVADKENGEMRLYLDGIEVASREWAGTLYMNSQLPLYIGCHYKEDFPGQYFGHFRGRMDDLGIWKKTLNEEQLTELMFCTSRVIGDPDLISFWDFHEGSGQFSYDISDYHHQATLLFSSAFVTEAPYGTGPFTVDWSTGQTGSSIDVVVESDQIVTAIATDIQGNIRMDEVLLENVPDGFTQETFSVCQGESFVFPDGYTIDNITSPTSYYSELQTANGCDSAVMTMIVPIQVNTNTSTSSLSISCTNQADAWQWFRCTDVVEPIPGATSYTYYPQEDGDYSVEITKNGCMGTSDCIEFQLPIVLSLNELDIKGFQIYPNPNMGQFTLSIDEGQGSTQVEIRNMEGRKVYSRPMGYEIKKRLNLTLIPGMYLISVITEDGLMTNQKMIVH